MYIQILKREKESKNTSKEQSYRLNEILNNDKANVNKGNTQKLYERLGHFTS